MIKAEELRLGTFIYAAVDENDKLLVCQVTQLKQRGLVWSSDLGTDPQGKNYTGYEFIDSIPLTHDWLIRFGFEFDSHTYSRGNFWLAPTKTNRYEVFLTGLYNGSQTTLDFVHELQNLYFSIMGSELEWKP